MKKVLFFCLTAGLICGISYVVKQGIDHASRPKITIDKTTSTEKLISRLGTANAVESIDIRTSLIARGRGILPELRGAIANNKNASHKNRLKTVVTKLCQPSWRSGLKVALDEAKADDRMLLVFSTIGGVNGYS